MCSQKATPTLTLPPTNNLSNLDNLLRESLYLENRRKSQSIRARCDELQKELHSRLHNPENWIQSGVVSILHTSESGETTTIGLFQEFSHKKIPNMRKLHRVSSNDLTESSAFAPVKQECVKGQFWINGVQMNQPAGVHEFDPVAQQQIRSYIERTRPPTLTEQLKELNVDQLLEGLMQIGSWKRVYP